MTPRNFAVASDHEASYSDPIEFKTGSVVTLTDRLDVWDGHRWVWARSEEGKEGWIPDDITEPKGDRRVALRDYSASELTCRVGETVTGLWATHGWTWCRNRSGETGWVPSRILEPI